MRTPRSLGVTLSGEMPISMDLVMWHEGRRLALIAYVALGATDADESERLALEAADRL